MTPARTILICEDERHLRNDICEELREAGYVTLDACDGVEALKLLEGARPDLILCDIAMPRMDGRALLARLRETRDDLDTVPFLFLTAFGDRTDIIDGKMRGADDYIVKPVDYEVLLATIEAHLRQVQRVSTAREAGQVLSDARGALDEAEAGAWAALDRLAQGIVLLDETGQVLHANGEARRICQPGSGLRLEGAPRDEQRDELRAEVEPARLRALLAEALTSETTASVAPVPLERPDRGHGPILLLSRLGAEATVPGGAALMALIVDPAHRVSPDPEVLRRALRLTPTEARIAAMLAGGMRSDAVADTMGVSPSTVASHLKSIFAKTETHRQTDLVALLLSLSVLPSPEQGRRSGTPPR